MKVWALYLDDYEDSMIISLHATKDGALAALVERVDTVELLDRDRVEEDGEMYEVYSYKCQNGPWTEGYAISEWLVKP